MLTALPYHRKSLSNGIELAYVDQGKGDPILLLHGFTGTARSHFAGLIDELAHDYRILAPDLRGYGQSRPPLRDFPPYFYQRDADDAAALLDALADGPAHVLGFSDGGESALLLAATRPDLVRSVVAWGVSGVISRRMVEAVECWRTPAEWIASHPGRATEIADAHGSDQVESMLQGWARAANAIYNAGGNVCMVEAANIQCPVLLINGSGELNNRSQDVLALSARIPDATLRFMEEADHAVHWDQSARMEQAIRAFLEDR